MKKSIFLFALALIFISCRTAERKRKARIFAPSRLEHVLGQDGVNPFRVKFENGEEKLLWTFGDTILGEWKKPITAAETLKFSDITDMKAMPSNSLALSDIPTKGNIEKLKFVFYSENGETTQFIKYKKNESPFLLRLWANGGVQIGKTAYVYYMRIKTRKNSDFDVSGTELAKSPVPEKPDINAFTFKRVENFHIPGIILGDSVLRSFSKNYVFLSGRTAKDGKKYVYLSLAKVKARNIEQSDKYLYLSQDGKWSGKPGKFIGDISGEASLVYDEYDKIFRIIYMSLSEQSVKCLTFSNIENLPESKPKTLFKPEKKKGILYYSAKEIHHTPESIYIIYMNPSIYQPMLAKIEK